MSSVLPKNEIEHSNLCPSLLGQKFFVRFLVELKKTKSRFKIKWPLVRHVSPASTESSKLGIQDIF